MKDSKWGEGYSEGREPLKLASKASDLPLLQ